MLIGVSDESDADAYITDENGVKYLLSSSDRTAKVTTGYSGSSTEVTIPSTVKSGDVTYNVTSINVSAFSGRNDITKVIVGDKVTSIGSGAFYNCTYLTTVEIKGSVTTIDSNTFQGCTNLTTINIPNTVTTIGTNAFEKCTSLGSIDIPNSVTSVSSNVFNGCTSLSSVTIGSGLTVIGDNMFQGCTSLGSITIPGNITKISMSAFNGCTALASITIPNSVTYIEYQAFNGCISLTTVTFGNSVTDIGHNAFGDIKFYDTNETTQLTDVRYLKGHTFTGTYPNLIKVGSSNVCGYGVTYEYDSTANALTINKTGEGDGSMYDYYSGNATPWDGYKENIKEITIISGVTTIGVRAFAGCTNLDSVTISNSVTSIKNFAFDSCQNISSITIPDSVTTVGEGAFSGCQGLTSVTMGSGINEIAVQMFYRCSSLQSITIPSSVTSIGSQAFSGCSSLRSLTIGGDVTIGNAAFDNCHDVTVKVTGSINNDMFSSHTFFTGLVIASGVESIGTNAFLSCSSLASVTIEENSGLKTIGKYAFQNCASLKSINLEKAIGLETISEYAFAGCSILGSVADKPVTIPSSVETIGMYAFYDCDELKSVTIPASVETIEDYAFSYCASLETVTITSGVKKISYGAFSLSPLKSLTIPGSVVTIESNAFNGLRFIDSNGNELDATVANLAGYEFTGTDGTTLKRSGSPTPPTYVVSYDSDGGSLSPRFNTVNPGDSVSLPDPGTKTGYSFAGWYTSIGTRVGGSGDSYTPQSSITLYAHWTTGETDPDTADDTKIKGLDANGQFLLVTFASIISLTALALIITRKR